MSDVAKYLDSPSDRLVASIIVTVAMLLVATAVSFVAPLWVVLTVLFGPGILTFAFGGVVVKKRWDYQLSEYQKNAINYYRFADDETKKLFPKDWEKTVRNAKPSPTGHAKTNNQLQLMVAANEIIQATEKRKQSLDLGDDKVIVALKMLRENTDMLNNETESNKEILS